MPPSVDPAVPAGGADGEARWKPWASVLGLVAGFGGAILGALVISVVALAFGADLKDPPSWVDISSTVVQDLCLIVAAIVFATMTGRPRPWNFGLRWPVSVLRAAGWFILAYLAFTVFSAIWISLLDLHNEKDTLPQDLGAKDSTVALLAVGFLVCVVAPFAEEFFFRGFFFRSLTNWKGVWPAAIITGLVFGAIHAAGSPAGFLLPLAFLGFVLCILYWKTESLLPCIVLHCVNNCIAYGTAVDWTWQIPVAIVVSITILGGIVLAARRIWGPPPSPAAPFAPIAAARQS